jgi:hypothetical protein
MRGVRDRDKDGSRDRRFALLILLVIVPCIFLVYISYINYTARSLGQDVYTSWKVLERSLETKAEAAALLSGYLVRSSVAGSEVFNRMFNCWEDVLSAEVPREKIKAGQRANIESYGIIALAKAETARLNERALRLLEVLDSLELRLVEDIERYNKSVIELRARRGEFYLSGMFMAFSGSGDFDLFEVGRRGID